jgi:hypothetical protein
LLGAIGLVAGLVGASLVLSAGAGSPAPTEVQATPGVVVTSTAFGDGEVLLTVLDVGRQRLAVYQADAKRSRLKLLAVRDISADMALTDYNNDPPLPRDVRARVEKGSEAPRPAPVADSGQSPPAP